MAKATPLLAQLSLAQRRTIIHMRPSEKLWWGMIGVRQNTMARLVDLGICEVVSKSCYGNPSGWELTRLGERVREQLLEEPCGE